MCRRIIIYRLIKLFSFCRKHVKGDSGTLDKTISDLETELAAARSAQDSLLSGPALTQDMKIPDLIKKRKYLMVVGINTAFSSRKRRDSQRATWMPQGAQLLDIFLRYVSPKLLLNV